MGMDVGRVILNDVDFIFEDFKPFSPILSLNRMIAG